MKPAQTHNFRVCKTYSLIPVSFITYIAQLLLTQAQVGKFYRFCRGLHSFYKYADNHLHCPMMEEVSLKTELYT